MREITKEQLKEILEKHRLWLNSGRGERANLSDADLSYADLSYADLRSADLRSADLSYADLRSAYLRSADLRSANLRSAYLRSADLRSANLRYADLSHADLRSANLSDADLSYAVGNLIHLKSIFIERYPITYTADVMQIGCERHAIADWWEFDDERIGRMDNGALEWWKKWQPFIQQAIELSPAEPTGYEEKQEDAA